jgi:arsenate reductase (thioredoxin)
MKHDLKPEIRVFCELRLTEFDQIPEERKVLLEQIANYIQTKRNSKEEVQLIYVCTHNSRRSHFGQVWAAVAAAYFDIDKVKTYSGGTEATAFHPNAIAALQRAGFDIQADGKTSNPHYEVTFGDNLSIHCYSKTYDDSSNPQNNFAAIMTCSDADENCPFIPGVALRIGTTYDDPKTFDGTNQEAAKYDERCAQIARECLYVFSYLA